MCERCERGEGGGGQTLQCGQEGMHSGSVACCRLTPTTTGARSAYSWASCLRFKGAISKSQENVQSGGSYLPTSWTRELIASAEINTSAMSGCAHDCSCTMARGLGRHWGGAKGRLLR